METILFLAFVALCAAGLVALIVRHNQRMKIKPSEEREARRHNDPLYQYRAAQHSLLHTHAAHLPSERRDIWHGHRVRATDEHLLKSRTLTASRLRSDEEIERGTDDEMTMGAVEYRPEDLPQSADGKKR